MNYRLFGQDYGKAWQLGHPDSSVDDLEQAITHAIEEINVPGDMRLDFILGCYAEAIQVNKDKDKERTQEQEKERGEPYEPEGD